MLTSISETITFGTSGNAQQLQADGWSESENGFTWTLGAESTLCLDSPFAPYGFFVEADWSPIVDPPCLDAQPVVVSVNDKICYRGNVAQPGLVAFLCPAPKSYPSRLVLRFQHPEAFRPSDRLGSPDKRRLALMFRRIRIMPLLEPVAAGSPKSKSSLLIEGHSIDELARQAEAAAGCELADIFGCFELIAGNCDMGMAQRFFGYDHLSLLRFGGATIEVAMKCLETDFAGIGERIDAHVADNPIQEWMILDETGFRFHSGQSSRQISREQVLGKFGRYARRLAQKLIEDVESGEKIFVCADHQNLEIGRSVDSILPFYLTLRRRGGRKMLWVCPAGGLSPRRGSAIEILPGLVQAHLDLLGLPIATGTRITLSGWLTVLINGWRVLSNRENM
jgi:hypothetical protein